MCTGSACRGLFYRLILPLRMCREPSWYLGSWSDSGVVAGRADRVFGGWVRGLLAGVVVMFGKPGDRVCRVDGFLV